MSTRDWLMIAGFAVLLIVALDGIRRMRKKSRIRLEIDPKFQDLPDDDLSSELPNGGARRVGEGTDETASVVHREPTFSEDVLLDTPPTADFPTADSPSVQVEQAEAPVTARREELDADDFDLLMADELKGVGQGADRWLESSRDNDVDNNFDDGVISASRRVKVPEASPAPQALEHEVDHAAAETDKAEPEIVIAEAAPTALSEQPSAAAATGLSKTSDANDEPPHSLADLPSSDSAIDAEPLSLDSAPEKPLAASFSLVEPEPAGLDLNQPIPVLMEQLARRQSASEEVEPATPSAQAEALEPPLPVDIDPLVAEEPNSAPVDTPAAESEPAKENPEGSSKPKPKGKGRSFWGREEVQTNFFDEIPDLAPEPEPLPAKKKRGRKKPKPAAKAEVKVAEEAPVDEVLVITVAAKQQPFRGRSLLKLVEACDLHYGEMDIYHRHEQSGAQGPIQFSMANAVKPGTFVERDSEGFSTPAVTFFLKMDEPKDLSNAFDCMLATAECVAKNLEGELKDENRSKIRSQTIEYYRQRIRDYERRRLTRRA